MQKESDQMKPVIVGNLGGFGKSVRFRVMMTEAGWRVVQRILSELEGATPSACNPYCEAGVSSPKFFLEQDQSQIQRLCELNNTERTRVGKDPKQTQPDFFFFAISFTRTVSLSGSMRSNGCWIR